jgi:uncharacterized C2H2 Zn-finger protein
MNEKSTPLRLKKTFFYRCETCDFNGNQKCDYEKHLQTKKHFYKINVSEINEKSTEKLFLGKTTCQQCEKVFKDRSGLWRHNKTCKTINIQSSNHKVSPEIEPIYYNGKDISNLKPEECSVDIIMHLVKQNEEFKQIMAIQNEEFKQIMVDQNKNIIEMMNTQSVTNNNNTINSHNKTTNNQFNLNFFLNETCKDAMNINDFIDYVTVNLDDFENFGKVGYPKALGEIIVRNLNELDIKIRPIHCSDLKREVLHVKHDGVWHSDDSQKFIKRSITYVANKNIRQRPLWQDENPESKNCLSTTYERFNNICLASLGPATDEQEADFLKKITNTIARQVVIDKKKKY